ncbi:uncharacterized protein LOC118750851, partial [Rhagoletis pomonella]|uniref:uncharacterized protein LOC118750851 n=1 Tax=Rhagoletis pomonella TaxID=28610 RepID=UPI00177F8297
MYILSAIQEQKLKAAVRLFPSFEEQGLGKTSFVEHVIDVGSAKPIKQRHYPISPAIEKLMGQEIDRMLAMGVIEELQWTILSSPVVLVNGEGYLSIAAHSGNIEQASSRRIYFQPGLKRCFWRIPLEEGSRDKTAFTVPNRPLYQFK